MENSIPRIPPPIYLVLAIVAMILLNSFAPIGHWLSNPWRWLGILIIVFAVSLGAGSAMYFRKLGTNLRPGMRAQVLVTTGPFQFTRNPMYVALTTVLVGVAIILGSYSPLLVIPVFFFIIHTQFVLREEKWMEDWFGPTYLEYKKKTPRWVL